MKDIGYNLGNALQRLAERNQNRIFGPLAIRHKIAQDRKARGCRGGKPWATPSRYMPHQGKREIERRLRLAVT